LHLQKLQSTATKHQGIEEEAQQTLSVVVREALYHKSNIMQRSDADTIDWSTRLDHCVLCSLL